MNDGTFPRFVVLHSAEASRGHPPSSQDLRQHLPRARGRGGGQACRVSYYPDVMVACGEEPEDPYIEDEPCLVVERLAPSSQNTDRREKLMVYRPPGDQKGRAPLPRRGGDLAQGRPPRRGTLPRALPAGHRAYARWDLRGTVGSRLTDVPYPSPGFGTMPICVLSRRPRGRLFRGVLGRTRALRARR